MKDFNMQLHKLSAWQLSEKIKNKEISIEEVIEYFTERIKKINPHFNAVISLFDPPIFSEEKKDSPLWGVPIVIKDNICIKDKEITCASRILKGFISPYDATVIRKIKEAGLIILGITNMDEFAFGSSCENSCYGPTLNPWNREYVPGGSSGGSATAVALGLSPLALGSDTGGSIRQPASFCGVVGFKPTYGRVSRFGLVAFGSSLDQIGPFCRDIRDCAYLLNIISGKDPNDSTTSSCKVDDYSQYLNDNVKGFKVGLPKEYFREGLDKEVKAKIDEVIKVLSSKGVIFEEVSLPHTEYAVPTYYILAPSEASSNLSRFDGIKYGLRKRGQSLIDTYKYSRQDGFGEEAKRRILLGTFSLSSGYYEAYYLKALKVRRLIREDFVKVFRYYDAILTPTSPTPPFKLGERLKDPLSMYLSDVYTISSNLAGLPSVSLPCGFTENNLPIGFQIIGDRFCEAKLIQLSYSYQKDTNWHTYFPKEYEGRI